MGLEEAGGEVVDGANQLVDHAQALLDKTVDAGQDLGASAAKEVIGAVADTLSTLAKTVQHLTDSLAKKE